MHHKRLLKAKKKKVFFFSQLCFFRCRWDSNLTEFPASRLSSEAPTLATPEGRSSGAGGAVSSIAPRPHNRPRKRRDGTERNLPGQNVSRGCRGAAAKVPGLTPPPVTPQPPGPPRLLTLPGRGLSRGSRPRPVPKSGGTSLSLPPRLPPTF